jgi:hypothetical protein
MTKKEIKAKTREKEIQKSSNIMRNNVSTKEKMSLQKMNLKGKFKDEEINIPWDTLLENKGFLGCNLRAHMYQFERNIDGLRKIYGDENGEGVIGGLKFLGKQIIKREIIDSDYDYGVQTVRATQNERVEEIIADIIKNGYSLLEIPPAVLKLKTKDGIYEYRLLEGRTRDKFFAGQGIEYIIVDVYEHVDTSQNVNDFAFFMNTFGKPKGYAKPEDLVVYLTSEIQGDSNPCEGMTGPEVFVWITKREKDLSMTLTESQKNLLVNDTIGHLTGAKPVMTFTDKDDVKKWLNDIGCKDTKKVRYYPITSDAWNGTKALERIIKQIKKDNNGFTGEIRGIVWSGTLNGKNPVNDWKTRNIKVFKKHVDAVNFVIKYFYDENASAKRGKISFYGTVPQCLALEDKYPLDKIVKYGAY